MNAQTRIASERAMFLNGGRLDVLMYGYEESERQFAEARKREKDEALKIMVRGLREFGAIKECPCGCGLKNDICQAHASVVADKNDEIPF
jgi:hypothetical protein